MKSNELVVNKLTSSTKRVLKRSSGEDQNSDIGGPGPRTEINQKYQSQTDPEATLVRRRGFKTRPRYKNHRVVDDAHGVITAVQTTTGRINESHELMELIDQHQSNTAIAPQTVVADCKYGTIENYVACQKRKLRTHMADLLGTSSGGGRRDGIYPESMFCYQPESDTFLCRAGQVMKPRRLHSVRLSWEYVTKRGVGLKCHLRNFCNRSRTGRTMRHHQDQKLLDRARRQANTKQAKLDRMRRQHLIERSFADASNLHGFKRDRWRGLIKQSIQDLLIATVQNLRKLIAAIQNAPESVWKTLIRTLWPLYATLSALLRPRRQRTLASAEPASSVRLLPRRTQLFGQQTDLTRPDCTSYIPRHCRKVVGFLTRDEIVAILLGGGPEHLDRTARLRASAHDALGFARCHNDGTA